MNVEAIKAITGELIMAIREEKAPTSSIVLDSPTKGEGTKEVVYTDLRVAALGRHPNGQEAVTIYPWIFTQPNKELTEQEWDDLRICSAFVPPQLEAIYLQQVTGIEIARS